jgi:hypothetical protein
MLSAICRARVESGCWARSGTARNVAAPMMRIFIFSGLNVRPSTWFGGSWTRRRSGATRSDDWWCSTVGENDGAGGGPVCGRLHVVDALGRKLDRAGCVRRVRNAREIPAETAVRCMDDRTAGGCGRFDVCDGIARRGSQTCVRNAAQRRNRQMDRRPKQGQETQSRPSPHHRSKDIRDERVGLPDGRTAAVGACDDP